jgi:aminoglycoside phosphotransferase (APT) family kinase protein
MKVAIADPFGAAADRAMPTLAAALDPRRAHRALKRGLPRLTGPDTVVRLTAARVTRYKPARRCVVEYDVQLERDSAPAEPVTLIGKVRARRFGLSGYRRLDAVWRAGFQADSPDGVSVPEPLGFVTELNMWFQRKIDGHVATELLAGPQGIELVARIVDAADKLHVANVGTEKAHTMADELRILRHWVPRAAAGDPARARRIDRLLRVCERLGATTASAPTTSIHRDFYGDQVIVAGDRLYLIDFDELCAGDPALDAGNFLGTLTELAFRTSGDPASLAPVESALEKRFVQRAGEAAAARARVYALLALVRHVWVAHRLPDRRHLVPGLLDLCEERLLGGHLKAF